MPVHYTRYIDTNAAGDKILFETEHCRIAIPQRPHVSREEGGHMVIFPKRKVSERFELTEAEAYDMLITSIRLGRAMTEVLGSQGVDIKTINYQDNSNWSFLRGDDKPSLHLHLYGRVPDTVYQTFGQSLYFPDPNDHPEFYDRNIPLTDEDTEKIFMRFVELSQPEANCPAKA